MKAGWEIGDLGPGWTVCIRANAKNRMGAYIGKQATAFRFRGGELVPSVDGPGIDAYCSDASYAPFPEIEQTG